MSDASPLTHPAQRFSLLRSFVRNFLLALVLFAPFLVIDKGFFLYCGDFNSQQQPFTYHMTQLIKDGFAAGSFPAYSWATDLGTGFVEGYSFYLLGSPFFWLGSLLPQSWTPYLLAPLLCLATNYFFFVGQVVFIVIYFVLRLLCGDWKPDLKKFGVFCFEAVLGVGLAMLAYALGDIQIYGLLAIPVLLLYSGRRGKWKLKYFFYLFYPLHMLILYFIRLIF